MEKKYVELENIAINNDVKNFTKELDITISDKKVWFKDNSEWYTEEGVDFSSNFAVDQAGKATASLKSDRINAVTKEILSRTHHHAGLYQAKSDQYEIIKHHSDGFSISFNSAQQMSDFSEMLNNGIEKKKSILLDIKNKAQLFK